MRLTEAQRETFLTGLEWMSEEAKRASRRT
jgi:hypothetical protein